MKLWMVFVLLTILCWGAYVPTLHQGQKDLGANSALRAFLFVGLADVLVALAVLGYVLISASEPMEFTNRGMSLSTLAGILGAIGALGIVFALKPHGVNPGASPLVVAPLVFAGAPIMNTIVSMAWHRPSAPPSAMFYVGIVLAAVGASLVLRFKPA
jgi:hypothetical protein